ncbi:hypothetical protein PI125_g21198 [Phytophthora idaei]|nr:hypothetical protein PI125_g21198 [Phytophthora idaei]
MLSVALYTTTNWKLKGALLPSGRQFKQLRDDLYNDGATDASVAVKGGAACRAPVWLGPLPMLVLGWAPALCTSTVS